jgi:hypothetical protein
MVTDEMIVKVSRGWIRYTERHEATDEWVLDPVAKWMNEGQCDAVWRLILALCMQVDEADLADHSGRCNSRARASLMDDGCCGLYCGELPWRRIPSEGVSGEGFEGPGRGSEGPPTQACPPVATAPLAGVVGWWPWRPARSTIC